MSPGLLLINLGTPSYPSAGAVAAYLREFLTDKRVIDIPWPLRYLLVYGLIIPFRSKKSAHAYQSIWTKQGSPLLNFSQHLLAELQKITSQYTVALGMRYGSPSIQSALDSLNHCDSITVLPLYPQYSSAATGSCIEEVFRLFSKQHTLPSIKVIRDFYQHPAYIGAQAALIKQHLKRDHHLLFSYHGVPERHLHKAGCKNLCPNSCPVTSSINSRCYKAQCYDTSNRLAAQVNLAAEQYSTAFQSRLGKTPWIRPYTDELLTALAQKGIKKLSISAPSFVADCLETLEELGMRARDQWMSLGGQEFNLIPSMNTDPLWVQAILELCKSPT
jgi:ferrochelatase